MKCFILLCLVAVVAARNMKRAPIDLSSLGHSMFAACVEACPPSGCPPGFQCRSNGCGHTCQPVLGRNAIRSTIPKKDNCPQRNCVLMCKDGFKLDHLGCPYCSCVDDIVIF